VNGLDIHIGHSDSGIGWNPRQILSSRRTFTGNAFSASLGYYDSYRAARLPANLLQAQRDFFGAHTYERTDKPEGQFFHTDWPEVIG
jgi:6-phosphogluconate dehydrogenase